MADKPLKAIGYVRVSTEEQATEGVSLDAQRAKVLAYCGLHGLELAQTYGDEGLSGKRADNRPGLQEAITHTCECHGVLIVYSLSRLARSTRDAIDIAERLATSKADLVSITEKIDTTTSIGQFFFTTVAALAHAARAPWKYGWPMVKRRNCRQANVGPRCPVCGVCGGNGAFPGQRLAVAFGECNDAYVYFRDQFWKNGIIQAS